MSRSKIVRLTPSARLSDPAGPGIVLNIDGRASIHEELAAVTVRVFELEAASCKVVAELGKALRLQSALMERLNRLSRPRQGLAGLINNRAVRCDRP